MWEDWSQYGAYTGGIRSSQAWPYVLLSFVLVVGFIDLKEKDTHHRSKSFRPSHTHTEWTWKWKRATGTEKKRSENMIPKYLLSLRV